MNLLTKLETLIDVYRFAILVKQDITWSESVLGISLLITFTLLNVAITLLISLLNGTQRVTKIKSLITQSLKKKVVNKEAN